MLYTEIKGKMLECQDKIKNGNCTCCKDTRKPGNWIALLPNEWEDILKSEASHQFEIVRNHSPFGGKEVICILQGKNCIYQPLDCRLYPFFPKEIDIVSNHIKLYIGNKCPINQDILMKYYDSTCKLILDLCKKSPELVKWFENAAYNLKEYRSIDNKD